MERCKVAILDADFAIRVGATQVINVIGDLLPQFCEKLYIHRHVFENEILVPPLVKQRIQTLLDKGLAEIVDQESVEQKGGPLAVAVYEATVKMLLAADGDTQEGGKNWGEVVSLALAKALNIPVFLSDDTGCQQLVDNCLNLKDNPEGEGNIRIVRVVNFVIWMRDNGLARKWGRVLWIAAEKPRDGFDRIWPPMSST